MVKLFATEYTGRTLSCLYKGAGEVCSFASGLFYGGIVGYIHCCSGLRKSRSFSLALQMGYLVSEMDYLEKCPVCGHCVIQITRINIDNKVELIRKTNQKALDLLEKLETSILFEKKIFSYRVNSYSSFYLNYNEFGKKKKCYSNLRSLKMGLLESENFSQKRILQKI